MKIKIDLKVFLLVIAYILTNKIEIFSILFIFMFVHELGHLFIGMCLGLRPKRINLTIAGFSIEFIEKECYNYVTKSKIRLRNKILVYIGGPISNLIFVFIGYFAKIPNIVYANTIIFLINILPILPLDGGQIIKNILMYKYTLKTVNKVMLEISKYNLIILTLIFSIAVIYLNNPIIAIFVLYLWVLYIKEKKKSNMISNMYKIIAKEFILEKDIEK